MRRIATTTMELALVDDDCFDQLYHYNWYLIKGYVCRITEADCQRTLIRMHREVFRIKGITILNGLEPDHKDRNKLNNQLQNLELVTHVRNTYNRSDNVSGHRGVRWIATRQKYVVQIRFENRTKHIGYYTTLKEAIAAREQAEKEYHE